MKSPHILVLTLSFGSGHVRAAEAIASEILRQVPNAEVVTIDALVDSGFLFRAGYVWPYWAMVRYAPRLWDRLFTRRLSQRHSSTVPHWIFEFGCPEVFKAIANFRPDTIVATEVGACEIASIARGKGITTARIVNVITDYETEPVWVQPEVDVYAVADKHVCNQLSDWRVPLERIVVCGIPTDREFQIRQDVQKTRAKYKLSNDAPIILVMGGGMGPTRMDHVVAFLTASAKRIQIVAVTGHDKRTLRRIEAFEPSTPATVRVLGWTNDLPALMQMASVLITKPGGLTTAEATVSALALVMFDPIPGPECRNAQRLVEKGAGILTSAAGEAATVALLLLDDESLRRRMSANAKRLARPDATAAVARLALNDSVAEPRLASAITA